MNSTQNTLGSRAIAALSAEASSTRLQAALAVGTHPDPGLVDVLVERCAVEPDFFVRDMLTWALTRLPQEVTLPKLLAELKSEHTSAPVVAWDAWTAYERRGTVERHPVARPDYGLRAHSAQMSPVITQIEPGPPVLADRSGAS